VTGHIRRRGKRSWQLKFDAGTDPQAGRRITKYHSFKGSKREAEVELTRLLASADRGAYVDPSKITLNEFLDRWELEWAQSNLGGKSLERYRDLLRTHVRPYLGSHPLQRLKASHLSVLYAQLLSQGRQGKGANPGLHPRTVGYVHRVLHRALGHAVQWGLLANNPATAVDPPRVTRSEVAILSEADVKVVLRKLRGRPIYLLAALGLATGLRRGEMLALRWNDVDLRAGRLRVERSLEETRAGLQFKGPKTKHGRRTLSLPASIVVELKTHRKAQVTERLSLGLGKEPDDALVFRQLDGKPLKPNSVSTEWRHLVKRLGLPKVTLHGWRHTHASQLIASGMDVLTICRRLGHGSPSITLDVYGHVFKSNDEKAAAVFEEAFGALLTKRVQK